MLGKLKKSEAGWYVLFQSKKNVTFGEPIMIRYLVHDNEKKLLSLQDQTVHFELEDETAIIKEPDLPEMVYCHCGKYVKCVCSPSN